MVIMIMMLTMKERERVQAALIPPLLLFEGAYVFGGPRMVPLVAQHRLYIGTPALLPPPP